MVAFNPALLLAEGAPAARFSALPMTMNSSGIRNNFGGDQSNTATITTSVNNTILVAVLVSVVGTSSTFATVASLATTGLTWTRRSQTQFTNFGGFGTTGNTMNVEVWWASCPTANTYSVAYAYSVVASANAVTVFAVSGVANASAPFDGATGPKASFSQNSASVQAAMSTGAFSVSAGHSLVFAVNFFADSRGANCTVGAIGSTTSTEINSIYSTTTGGMFSEYVVKTVAQSSITAAILGAQNYMVGVVDALAG
jgi:hypothetical protein